MTEEKRKYLIDSLTREIKEDDSLTFNLEDDFFDIEISNELIKRPEYLIAVNHVVDILDECSVVGQAENVIDLMKNIVLKKAIKLINI